MPPPGVVVCGRWQLREVLADFRFNHFDADGFDSSDTDCWSSATG